MEKDGRLVNRAPAPQVPDRNPSMQSNQIAQVNEATPEQLDSIKKYQVIFIFTPFILVLLEGTFENKLLLRGVRWINQIDFFTN